jgi:hypothetical protein
MARKDTHVTEGALCSSPYLAAAAAAAMTCRNPVLQTSQISVAAELFKQQQSALHCEYTLVMLFIDAVSTVTFYSYVTVTTRTAPNSKCGNGLPLIVI